MKAVMLNKKLWTDISVQEIESKSFAGPDYHVYSCGGCGCGCGCCCPYLCAVLIC